MSEKYENYYWQNDKVRLRVACPGEGVEDIDSEAWAMASEEMVLPVPKKDITTTDTDREMFPISAFSIENLDSEYVGIAHFNEINERHGTFELGLMLVRKFRNKGYGKAAMEILLAYAFNERRLNKLNADCIDVNTASIALLKSLGCQQEGVIREAIFYNGIFHDRLLFGLTANEYNIRHIK